jgi:hypothetical protein
MESSIKRRRMTMNFFKRRRFLKKANLLELTPLRLHSHEIKENGQIVLLVEKFKNKELGKFMLGRRSGQFRIRLDEMGSALWILMDGNSNVAELVSNLRNQWIEKPEKTEDMEQRVAMFMSQLYDNRYITFKELNELILN